MLIKLLTTKDLLKLFNNKAYQEDTEKKALNIIRQELSHRYEVMTRMWTKYCYYYEDMESMSKLKTTHIDQLIKIHIMKDFK